MVCCFIWMMTGERETCIYHVSNSSGILEVSERHIIPTEQPTVGAQAHRWQTAFRKQTPSSYITNIFMKLNDTKTLLSCIIVLCCVRSFLVNWSSSSPRSLARLQGLVWRSNVIVFTAVYEVFPWPCKAQWEDECLKVWLQETKICL